MEKILSEIYTKLEDKDQFKLWRLTRCDLCSKPACKPIYLPCSYSICRSHLPVEKFICPENSIATKISFVCFFCHNFHDIPPKGFSKNPIRRKILQMKKSSQVEYEKFMELSNFVLAADSEMLHFYHSALYPMNEIGFLCDKYCSRIDKQKELVPIKLAKVRDIVNNETLEWKNSCEKKITDDSLSLKNFDLSAYLDSLNYINSIGDNLEYSEYQNYVNCLLNLCKFDHEVYPKIEAEILNGLMYYRRLNMINPYRFRTPTDQNNFFDDRIKGIDYKSYIFTIQNLKGMTRKEGSLIKMVHFEFLNYAGILETKVVDDVQGKKYLSFRLKFRTDGPEEEVDVAAEIRLLSSEPTGHFGKVESVKVSTTDFEIKFGQFMAIEVPLNLSKIRLFFLDFFLF